MSYGRAAVERIKSTLCGERFRREDLRACVGWPDHPPTVVCETCSDEWAEDVFRRIDADDEKAAKTARVYVAAVALPAD
jgi:hypothetical protein